MHLTVLAKLQRKRRRLYERLYQEFNYKSRGENPNAAISILRSAENVELGAIIGYKDKDGKKNLLWKNIRGED